MGNRVINFHDVYDKIWFEKTITMLKNNYKIVGVKDIEDYFYKGKDLKNSCHITIDDGDKTFYHVIYPILKKYKIPATLFVSPKACRKQENFWFQEIASFDADKLKLIIAENFSIKSKKLSSYPVNDILKNLKINTIWEIISQYKAINNPLYAECRNISVEQLFEIDKEGLVTIGAHTLNHPILANEEDKDSQLEIEKSIDELVDILGHEIRYFAYPNGIPALDFGDREISVLKDKGCRLSFSTKLGNYSRKDNTYAIPRHAFSYGSFFFIKSKLLFSSYWEILKKIRGISEFKLRPEIKKVLNSNSYILK